MVKEFKFLQKCVKKYNMFRVGLELDRVKRGKTEIIDAIEEMGVEVPQGVLLNDLPKYIRQIGEGVAK